MKKIALILTGAFLSVSTVGSFASVSENVAVESNIFDGKKTKVEQSELPQEIIDGLEGSEYQSWEIQEAFKVEDEMTSAVHYELQLASSEDASMIKSVTFTESGEILTEQDAELGQFEEAAPQEDINQEVEPSLEEGSESTEPGTEVPAEQY